MSNELENVKNKIRKLINRTVINGCTEAEAMASANMIGKLLSHYNLSMDEVVLENEECKQSNFSIPGRKSRHPIDGCIVEIASFCDCKVWFNTGYGEYSFFGLSHDVDMAIYLSEIVFKSMITELKKFKKSNSYVNAPCHRKRLSISFQKGMATRISQRLYEILIKRKQKEKENHMMLDDKTSTDIVLLKKAKVNDEFKKMGIKLTKIKRHNTIGNIGAYEKGNMAGNKINLSRPLDKNKSNVKMLT